MSGADGEAPRGGPATAEVVRGGAAVGLMRDLGPVEAAAVLCLRLWGEGAAGQAAIRAELAASLGAGPAARLGAALDGVMDLCRRHGRRALARHHPDCPCVGGDEACFARCVAAAAEGAREDALMIAVLLVRADMAPWLVGLAGDLGLGLRRLSLRAARGTLH
jgi:hypothetical protein